MRGDLPDRLQPLLQALLLQDVQPDAVQGHGVAAEEDAVVIGHVRAGHADRRDLGRFSDMQDHLVAQAGRGENCGDGLGAVVDMETDLVGRHAQGDVLRRPGHAAVLVVLEDGDVDQLGDLPGDDPGKAGFLLVGDGHVIEPAKNAIEDFFNSLAIVFGGIKAPHLRFVFLGPLVAHPAQHPKPSHRIEELALGRGLEEIRPAEGPEFGQRAVVEGDIDFPVVAFDPGQDGFALGRRAHDPHSGRPFIEGQAGLLEFRVPAVPDDNGVFLDPGAFQSGHDGVDRLDRGGDAGSAEAVDLNAHDVRRRKKRRPGRGLGLLAGQLAHPRIEGPVHGGRIVFRVDEHVRGGHGNDPA